MISGGFIVEMRTEPLSYPDSAIQPWSCSHIQSFLSSFTSAFERGGRAQPPSSVNHCPVHVSLAQAMGWGERLKPQVHLMEDRGP